jgi:hypothetical protein
MFSPIRPQYSHVSNFGKLEIFHLRWIISAGSMSKSSGNDSSHLHDNNSDGEGYVPELSVSPFREKFLHSHFFHFREKVFHSGIHRTFLIVPCAFTLPRRTWTCKLKCHRDWYSALHHVLSIPGTSRADESTEPVTFSRWQPSAQHLKTGQTGDCNSSDGQSAIVLTSTFAPTIPDRSHDKFCKAWQCPGLSSNQMQLAIAGSAESIWMATVESSRASCSKMSIQSQGARQTLLPWCSLLANMLIRASQTGWYSLSMLQGS